MTPTIFCVVYRTGGTLNAEWHRTIPVAKYSKAQKLAEDIRRGGRKALVVNYQHLLSIGLPEGWDAN